MAVTTLDPHYTVVRNTSAAERYFGYLGYHGVLLAAGADYKFPGNLVSHIGRDPRKVSALNFDLDNGNLEIIQTPTTVGYDATYGGVKQLKFDNAAPITANPAYGAYTGPAPNFS